MLRCTRRTVLIWIGWTLPTVPQLLAQSPTPTPASAQTVPTSVVRTPKATELAQPIQQYFASQPGFKAGDVVTRDTTRHLLTQLEKAGWQVKDADQLLEKVLPESDFLVQQLKSDRGRAFLGKIRSTPGGIDCLDRILRMPHGQDNVRQLIQKVPNGHEWIEGMVESKHGRRMTTQMSKSATGRDVNKPTGRIYSVDELQQAIIQAAVWVGTKENSKS